MNLELIHNYLESSNLEVIVELSLKKYQGLDYYLNIVYDNEISKYKVIYLPLQIMNYEKISSYVCFQIIDEYYINYILKNINEFKEEFQYIKARNYKNKYIDNDLITISIKIHNEYYKFYATEYIPKELDYLYELMKIMFFYAPNAVHEVGKELVTLLEGKSTYIGYQDCIYFDLYNDNLDKFYNKKYKIDHLELVNDKYYAIVDNHLIILRYLKHEKILYLYSDNHSNKYFYAVISSIRKNQFFPFQRLKVMEKNGIHYYLSYDKSNKYYKIINKTTLDKIANNDLVVEIEKDEIKLV